MILIDSYFNYKYITRYKLINKFYLINTFNIPEIKKLIFLFHLEKIEDVNDIQFFNYFYLIKFFFGKNAYFSKINKYYLLGTWYYNINVILCLNNNKEIVNKLYYLYNNIIINVDRNLINAQRKNNYYCIKIKDNNIYSELKTNLGLFNIKKFIIINLVFKKKLNNYYNIINNMKYLIN